MVKDWFPSDVNPQSSKPPYVLDVITPGGKSVLDDMYQQAFYGPGQELTYTSKMVFFFYYSSGSFHFITSSLRKSSLKTGLRASQFIANF